jgi:ribosomal protein S3AE
MVWETDAILGKPAKVNVMTLTGNPKKQNMDAYFKVVDVKEGVGHTKILGIELQHNAARRLARRGRSKIADSFLAKTKTGDLIRVKPIIMTRSRTDNETQRALRSKAKQVIRAFTSKYTVETLINEIVNNRMQRFVKDELTDIFPVRSADIRYLKYEGKFKEEAGEVEEVEYEVRKKNLKKDAVDAIAALKDEVEAAMLEEDDEDEDEEDLVAALKADSDVSEEELDFDTDSSDEDEDEEDKK